MACAHPPNALVANCADCFPAHSYMDLRCAADLGVHGPRRLEAMYRRKAYMSAAAGTFYLTQANGQESNVTAENNTPGFFTSPEVGGRPLTLELVDALVRSVGCCLWNALSEPVHHSQLAFYDPNSPYAQETARVQAGIIADAEMYAAWSNGRPGALTVQEVRKILEDANEVRHRLAAHPEKQNKPADVRDQLENPDAPADTKYRARLVPAATPAHPQCVQLSLHVDYVAAVEKLHKAVIILHLLNVNVLFTGGGDQYTFHALPAGNFQPTRVTQAAFTTMMQRVNRERARVRAVTMEAVEAHTPQPFANPNNIPQERMLRLFVIRFLLRSALLSLDRAAAPPQPPAGPAADRNNWLDPVPFSVFNEQCGVVAHYYARKFLRQIPTIQGQPALALPIPPVGSPEHATVQAETLADDQRFTKQNRHNYVHFTVISEVLRHAVVPAPPPPAAASVTLRLPRADGAHAARLTAADVVLMRSSIERHMAFINASLG